MLRVIKPTSSLSIGSYLLEPFSAAALATAAVELLGWFPRLKRFGGVVAGLFGGSLATYTGVLLANTAVPSWHAAYEELPFVFAGSAMAAGTGITDLYSGGRGWVVVEDGGGRGGDRVGRGAPGESRARHRQRAAPQG